MNKWIPVSEDLPDYDVPVLWFTEDGLMHVEDLDKDGNPWLFGEELTEGFKMPKATHWMPLPPMPNNEQKPEECDARKDASSNQS